MPTPHWRLILNGKSADDENLREAVQAMRARGREIGIHAVRGGTVAGEHRVIFYGEDEVLEFKHSATSRQIFVNGAVRAARFAVGKPAGLYTMQHVMGEVKA